MITKPQAKVVKMSSNRITVKELAIEIDAMKSENTLQHTQMRDRMDTLQNDIKDNKAWFNSRLDKLDQRIWAIVMLTLGSLLASILTMIVS
jgi:hypothetical protein